MSARQEDEAGTLLPFPHRPRHYHSVGIGAGPANLSLAALFQSVAPHRIALFEQSPGPAWHPTLLHPGVRMQTAWIKDLVSLVDPQHRLSFLSYLVATGRVYAFLSAQFDSIPRLEYARYLAWAAAQLDDVHYGRRIDRVAFDGDGFCVYGDDGLLARSDQLVLGVGMRAKLPPQFDGIDADRVVLADDLAYRAGSLTCDPRARIAVVGGGQTGAECVLELLRLGVQDIWWFGRRPWFQTMEDSPSANDLYRPSYREFLPTLACDARRETVAKQVLTSDGIAEATLREIYQRNYEAMLESGRHPVTLLPGRDVVAADPHAAGLALTCEEAGGRATYELSAAVVAAGREPAPLPFDDDLHALLELDERGEPIVERDYSLRWNGPAGHKIFAQNRAASVHGLADKNLSLLAERSATIINAAFGREVFTLRDDYVTTRWGAAASAPALVPAPADLGAAFGLDEELAV